MARPLSRRNYLLFFLLLLRLLLLLLTLRKSIDLSPKLLQDGLEIATVCAIAADRVRLRVAISITASSVVGVAGGLFEWV